MRSGIVLSFRIRYHCTLLIELLAPSLRYHGPVVMYDDGQLEARRLVF